MCAVLVTYRPDPAVLAAQLAALVPQVARVVVVDNASPGNAVRGALDAYAQAPLELVALPVNRGLAFAQNAGIARAQGRPDIGYVLLMDQDSVPAADMVRELVAAHARLAGQARVAAVGPCFRDPREAADAPFIRIRFPFNRKLRCGRRGAAMRCDFLIASGCLIPLTVLDDVGAMDAGLFIDSVDLDWCFRATAKGYALYGVCGARLRHQLGADRYRIPGVRRGVVVHPPGRLYCMMRNRALLYRRAHTPRRWIAQDLPRVVVKLLLFGLLVPPRRRNLRAMCAGLAAGVRGRAGPPPGA